MRGLARLVMHQSHKRAAKQSEVHTQEFGRQEVSCLAVTCEAPIWRALALRNTGNGFFVGRLICCLGHRTLPTRTRGSRESGRQQVLSSVAYNTFACQLAAVFYGTVFKSFVLSRRSSASLVSPGGQHRSPVMPPVALS